MLSKQYQQRRHATSTAWNALLVLGCFCGLVYTFSYLHIVAYTSDQRMQLSISSSLLLTLDMAKPSSESLPTTIVVEPRQRGTRFNDLTTADRKNSLLRQKRETQQSLAKSQARSAPQEVVQPQNDKNNQNVGATPPAQLSPILSPRERFFAWADVNYDETATCGCNKCFFRSRTNPRLGYLVASERKSAAMKQGIRIAKDLEARFGAKHFHIDMTTTQVSEVLRRRLAAHVDQIANRAAGKPQQQVFPEQNGTHLVVERVMVAPESALFFAEKGANWELTKSSMADFVKTIPDHEAFLTQWQEEHERLKMIFEYIPALVVDFQAFIDTAGRLYHIDLDGYVSYQKRFNPSSTELQPRVERLLNRVEQLATLVRTGTDDGQAKF